MSANSEQPIQKVNQFAALIAKLKDSNPDVYFALKALGDDITGIRDALTRAPEVLTSTGKPNNIESLVFPKSDQAPPNAQPGEGKVYYDTKAKRHKASNDSYGYYDFPTPESARLTSLVNTNIASGVATMLPLATVSFSNMIDVSVASTIKIKTPGRYLCGGSVRWAGGAAGGTFRNLIIRLNGGAGFIAAYTVPASAIVLDLSTCVLADLVAGDSIDLVVTQDSGGVIAITGNLSFGPWLWAHRMG